SRVPFARTSAYEPVVTANADPVGGTLDNDPSNDVYEDGTRAFLSCKFDAGFRQERIEQRLRNLVEPLTLEDAAAVQADVRSALAAKMVPELLEAIERVNREREAPGTYPLLSSLAASERFAQVNIASWEALLRAWEARADYEALTGVTFADMGLTSDERETVASRATLLFHAWLVHVLDRVFSDELDAMGVTELADEVLIRSLLYLFERQPSALSSYDPELRDSIMWDDARTDVLESRDERLVTALLDALERLGDHLGDDVDRWRWGLVHTVRLAPRDASMGVLSMPPLSDVTFPSGFPRPGGLFTVDLAPFDAREVADADFGFTHGVAWRFVVSFGAAGPEATAALAGGQIADPARAHFSDGAEYWRHNATHAFVHRRSDVLTMARNREVAWAESKAPGVD
ncbi:MAG: penicillin acylase family protein, partial [Myxococcota bacterium]